MVLNDDLEGTSIPLVGGKSKVWTVSVVLLLLKFASLPFSLLNSSFSLSTFSVTLFNFSSSLFNTLTLLCIFCASLSSSLESTVSNWTLSCSLGFISTLGDDSFIPLEISLWSTGSSVAEIY